ncbi:MAG: polysaccharide deacetylase family protein [Tenuifilaceae bacterium]|jgi:peptidoglycan/xylan/chitin deacetylase (PgdA/CDA1 family)|nr:polysaccharide deacetylase family protein [Tenuifilaceae bacterium]
MLRDLIKTIASPLPFGLSVRIVKPGLVAAFYHTISHNAPAHIKHLYPIVSPEQFEKDLDFLARHFEPTDVKDYLQNVSSKNKAKPKLLLSFDDGFSEVAHMAAPILTAKGIPATVFVNPSFIDNNDMLYRCKASLLIDKILSNGAMVELPDGAKPYFDRPIIPSKKFAQWIGHVDFSQRELLHKLASELGVDFEKYLRVSKPYLSTEETLKLANDGFTIGAHSMDHPNFANITLDEQIEQVESSLQWVQENIPNQPRIFAFPFSSDGVSAAFYKYFLKDNPKICDLLMGTSGYKPTNTHKFINRIPLEVIGRNARQIIKGELNYYLAKRIINKHKVSIPL